MSRRRNRNTRGCHPPELQAEPRETTTAASQNPSSPSSPPRSQPEANSPQDSGQQPAVATTAVGDKDSARLPAAKLLRKHDELQGQLQGLIVELCLMESLERDEPSGGHAEPRAALQAEIAVLQEHIAELRADALHRWQAGDQELIRFVTRNLKRGEGGLVKSWWKKLRAFLQALAKARLRRSTSPDPARASSPEILAIVVPAQVPPPAPAQPPATAETPAAEALQDPSDEQNMRLRNERWLKTQPSLSQKEAAFSLAVSDRQIRNLVQASKLNQTPVGRIAIDGAFWSQFHLRHSAPE